MSLPENRKFTWKIRVHTTAWETRTHFFWDFKRRQAVSVLTIVQLCSWGYLLNARIEPWAVPLTLRTWNNKTGSELPPAGAAQHPTPQTQWERLTLPDCCTPNTASEKGKPITAAIIDKHGSLLFCTAGALSRYLGDMQNSRNLSTEHPNSPSEGPLF